MVIKGRIKYVSEVESRTKKDGSGTYSICNVHVQIGVYKQWQSTGFGDHREVEMPEMVIKSYFHDDARQAKEVFSVGDVVTVQMHHSISQYERTDTTVDSISVITKSPSAQPTAQLSAPTTPPAQPSAPAMVEAQENADLPF